MRPSGTPGGHGVSLGCWVDPAAFAGRHRPVKGMWALVLLMMNVLLADHLEYRRALPDHPDLDCLTSGVPEVDDFFRGHRWFLLEKG